MHVDYISANLLVPLIYIYIGQVDISVQEYSIVLINSSFKIKEVIIYTLTTLTWDVETFDISN